MIGISFLMSKVGITTFVKVWLNLLSPTIFLISVCRYFPSYFGPVRAFSRFVTVAHNPLYMFLSSRYHIYDLRLSTFHY